MTKFTIGQQINEVQAEIAMRERVYPGLVAKRKMRQSEADHKTSCMTAVLQTLRWLQVHENTIRSAVEAKK